MSFLVSAALFIFFDTATHLILCFSLTLPLRSVVDCSGSRPAPEELYSEYRTPDGEMKGGMRYIPYNFAPFRQYQLLLHT